MHLKIDTTINVLFLWDFYHNTFYTLYDLDEKISRMQILKYFNQVLLNSVAAAHSEFSALFRSRYFTNNIREIVQEQMHAQNAAYFTFYSSFEQIS